MAKISPSVLSADFMDLGSQIKELEKGGCDYIHFDVMDGAFVPNISFGAPVLKCMAGKTTIPFDVHLMIQNPDARIPDFVTPQTEFITVHQEACVHLHRTLQLIKSFGIKAGVALNPATPLSTVETIIDDIDLVLVMSVNPGFGGQKFIPSVWDKIAKLNALRNERKPDMLLAVDGGVSLENAKALRDAGIDILAAGSAVFKADSISERVKEFKNIIK